MYAMSGLAIFYRGDGSGMVFCKAGGEMAAVGLLPLAGVALEVATAVLPRYRSRGRQHPFTPPQLLAVRCRM